MKGSAPPRTLILAFLYGAFVTGGIYFGGIFASNAPLLFGSVAQLPQQLLALPAQLIPRSPDAPDWRDRGRVNLLLLGVDKRPDETLKYSRTDTMLVVTLDPYTKTAGMLGIPRDLFVPIPLGAKQVIRERINAAHVFGYLYDYPGGGPALAKQAVQYNLGIKIHYYALLDFDGFERIVDTLGGIDVDVERTIVDREYPTPDYGIMTIRIPAGRQHLNGEVALQYARTRHVDSDYGRMKRQQQVLLALRDRALQLDVIPKLPQLIGQFRDAVQTDLSVADMLALAALAKDIAAENIAAGTIDREYVTEGYASFGASVLIPKREKIAPLIQELFFDARQQQEAARVEVLNGTTVPGLAARTAKLLQNRGWRQVSYDTAKDGLNHGETQVYDYSGKLYSVRAIAELLNIPVERIQSTPDPQAPVDIRIILGKDLKLPEN